MVPDCRFNLFKLTNCIEAKFFQFFQIKTHGVVGCRCKDTIREITVIKRCKVECQLAIQIDIWFLTQFLHFNLTHTKVRSYIISSRTILLQCNINIIEERSFRRPEFSIRYRNGNFGSGSYVNRSYLGGTIHYFYCSNSTFGISSFHFHFHCGIIKRCKYHVGNISRIYLFCPDCLPDTCCRCI